VTEETTPLEGELIPKGLPATERELIEIGETMGVMLGRIKIASDDDLEAASEPMRQAAGHLKMLEKHRKDFLSPLRDFVTKVNAEYKVASDELDKGIRHAKQQVSAYQHKVQQEKDRLAREEAARIAKNAEKRAARVEKKAAESDNPDAAAEAAAEAENIRIQAELEAEHAAAAIATQEKAKAEGVSTRKDWKIEVTDVAAFIGAIAAGNDPRLTTDMVKVNQPALNKLAKALKEGCKGIPGTRVYYEDVLSVRSSK
jgi:membrane protein involved in colicin uptake